MSTEQRIYPLKGKVQHYSWGGYEFISRLLSIDNADKKPFAEYWLGAHPNHPSTIEIDNKEIPLDHFISQQNLAGTNQPFTLPFLFKILDVRQMLSIQVHPNKSSAATGFQRENEAGIPVNASNRNYKDDNHKPEMMVALSDFWLLHGFKPPAKLIETLSAIPGFEFLVEEFQASGYKGLYEKVMLMGQAEVNKVLEPIIQKILPLYHNGELLKSQESFWAARAAESFCANSQFDRGIFSIYFFNLVHLKKGEAIYQGAQLPHAYLEGQNVELMANSDNVLRAGLTEKHIDVAELLQHVAFIETVPNILGSTAGEKEELFFETAAEEFALYQYQLEETNINLHSHNPEIILVIDGKASITSGDNTLEVNAGDAVFVLGNTPYSIAARAAEAFRATTPSRA